MLAPAISKSTPHKQSTNRLMPPGVSANIGNPKTNKPSNSQRGQYSQTPNSYQRK